MNGGIYRLITGSQENNGTIGFISIAYKILIKIEFHQIIVDGLEGI